jgi:Fic-DOC domain mobile mystery protein B
MERRHEVTDPLIPVGDGHTDIPEEDRESLIPTYISTRGELFAAEQENITVALLGRHPTVDELLDDLYLRRLHKAMFERVWKWAGRYRRRDTNIGIDPSQISTEVRQLVGDAAKWIQSEHFDPDVVALRFHHRLVQIHPFVNGNGRHGRIAADLLIDALGHDLFTWGRNLDVGTEELRHRYLGALRRMDTDGNDISELIEFARR